MLSTAALAAFWLIIGHPSHTVGGEPSVDFVFSGFKDSRERLQEGTFRCRGVRIEDDPNTGRQQGDITIFCCFSYDAGKTRFDRVETVLAPSEKSGWKPAPTQQGGKYVKLPDKTITWLLGENGVLIKSAATEPPAQIRPFDVRTVGMATYITYEQGASFETVVTKTKGWIVRSNATVARRDGQVVRIEWSSNGDTMSLDFDESIGYLPVRLENRTSNGTGGFRVTEQSTVEWKQVNKVWVPDHVVVSTGAKPGRVLSYDLRFEWEKVNQSVSPELFMTRGLELPDGTMIASVEGKKTTQLGAVGDMTPNPKLAAIEPPTPPWWRGWKGLTVVAAGVLALVGCVVAFRRLGRKNRPAG